MRILIVEDETAAYENLADMLVTIDPTLEIMGNTESVQQTVRWLQANPRPDLIFMDIHLSDGSAFAIFDQIEVEAPIIFTTAYDQYAIDAFKVNSIDYILKPIKSEELKRALDKFSRWNHQDIIHYLSQLTQLSTTPKYKDKLLIPIKDKLLPISLKDVSCFYTADKNTYVYLKRGNSYPYAKTLEQIISSLSPADFPAMRLSCSSCLRVISPFSSKTASCRVTLLLLTQISFANFSWEIPGSRQIIKMYGCWHWAIP